MSPADRQGLPDAEIILEADRLFREGDFRRALTLYESLAGAGSLPSGGLLNAAECAIELRLPGRALEVLGQAEAKCVGVERERWVNLKSEALRRAGRVDEGLEFVTRQVGSVGAEVAGKLLVRKAAFLFAKGDHVSAKEAVRQGWSLVPTGDQRWLISVGNVALLAGETPIAASAGRRLLRDYRSIAGLVLWVFCSFLGLPLAARLVIGLLTALLLFLSSLRPLYLALIALLVVSAFVARRARLVTAAFSLLWSAIGLGAAYLLVFLADIGNMMLILAVIGAGIALVAVLLAVRRSRGDATSQQ